MGSPLSLTPVSLWRSENDLSNSFIKKASNSRGTQFFTSSSMTQSMASEPSLPTTSDTSSMLLQPKLAKWKMVSRTCGVMLLERGIQLKRWARQVRALEQTSSSRGSRGANEGGTRVPSEGEEEGVLVGVERCGREGVPNGER